MCDMFESKWESNSLTRGFRDLGDNSCLVLHSRENGRVSEMTEEGGGGEDREKCMRS